MDDNISGCSFTKKSFVSGPSSCKQGIHCIAKELELLNPNIFGNIFVGVGVFHHEKVINACFGKYLDESDINSISVEPEIFAPEVVTSVMASGNYVCGKRGIELISEALQRLHFQNVYTIYNRK